MIFTKKIKTTKGIILAVIFLLLVSSVILAILLSTTKQAPLYHPETAARVYLAAIWASQNSYCRDNLRDTDNDKIPEYASSMNELIKLGIFHKYFDPTGQEGEVYYKEYIYKIYTPQDPDAAEKYFCAVAWPKNYGGTSTATFLVLSDKRKIYKTRNSKYSGPGNGPKLEDAFTGELFKSSVNTSKWEEIEWPG